MQQLRVGWVQMEIAWERPRDNIDRVERLITGHEADIWVLPEMWSTGFTMDTDKADRPQGTAWQAMKRWSEQTQALFIGSVQTRTGEKARNRLYAVFPDGRTLIYDKRHLFRMAGENHFYEPGENRLIVEWKGWRLAPLICYDLRFPVWSRRTPEYDYEMLIYVANWPAVRHTHWAALLPARAIENQSYTLGVNRIGQDGNGHSYVGGSVLIDYKGQALLHSGEVEGAFVAEVFLKPLQEYREKFPVWRDADAFQLIPKSLWG
ncbi:MAG: amidohydrolase [Bacteroidia bacterium]